MSRIWFGGLILTIILGTATFTWAQQSDIRLTTLALVEKTVSTDGGRTEIRQVPAEKVVPGTDVIFATHYKNIGNHPVEHAVITNPIPADMVYKEGSARGAGTEVTFSVDGGKSYHPVADLFIYDSAGRKYPARPQDYTNIRWTFETVIPPGAEGDVSFTAVLQ